MLHLCRTMEGLIRRLNPTAIARLSPVSRRGGTVTFNSALAAPSQYEWTERKADKCKGEQSDHAKTHHGHGDAMTHSFGEGYSTRSDEEGFGGTHGGNQAVGCPSEINHPEYDKSQGSKVAGKEKARNQPHASS